MKPILTAKETLKKKEYWICPFCNIKTSAKGKGNHLKIHGYKIDTFKLIGLKDNPTIKNQR